MCTELTMGLYPRKQPNVVGRCRRHNLYSTGYVLVMAPWNSTKAKVPIVLDGIGSFDPSSLGSAPVRVSSDFVT